MGVCSRPPPSRTTGEKARDQSLASCGKHQWQATFLGNLLLHSRRREGLGRDVAKDEECQNLSPPPLSLLSHPSDLAVFEEGDAHISGYTSLVIVWDHAEIADVREGEKVTRGHNGPVGGLWKYPFRLVDEFLSPPLLGAESL